MYHLSRSLAIAIIGLAISTKALNPSCAPGGNFDLRPWLLQLPTGSTGDPDSITSAQLQGCNGYQDTAHKYFFTETSDGALVMKVPGSPATSGCVTTEHSLHCRTEFREVNPSDGSHAAWLPSSPTNRLSASLAVFMPDDSKYGTVVGQVHIDESVSTKPVCEMYYNASGHINMGVEHTRAGGNSTFTPVDQVAVGQTFSYEIRYESDVLSVGINGGPQKILDTYELDNPLSYFKAGNYNQGNSSSDVHFFAINVEH